MNYKIVTDSSANIFSLDGAELASAPLKIVTAEKEYADIPGLDVDGMIDDLKHYRGKSGSSCPNVAEWLSAFDGADNLFVFTITRNLSGSYSAAVQAAEEYRRLHPEVRIHIADTLSVGPEVLLQMEALRDGIRSGKSFEELCGMLDAFARHTHLCFALKSLTNLARNGRVSPVVAKMAGILGIRLVGKASDEGTLEPLHKCRGEEKALEAILEEMQLAGYNGGAVRLAPCQADDTAAALEALLRAKWPDADIRTSPCTALCSFYAESGGILVGYTDSLG